MRAILLAASVVAASASGAFACSWSKTDTVAKVEPTMTHATIPTRVVALKDVWLERLVA